MNRLFLTFLLGFLSIPTSLASEVTVISTDKIDWGLLNPLRGDASPRAADLWGDRTQDEATGLLVKFKQGFSSPPHSHNITYRGVVIHGALHNDDPTAERLWLSPGSFWTQPAGENHITAASGKENLIYLEIESGPYLVLPSDQAFDNGERPINIEARNLVWLSSEDVTSTEVAGVEISYLWGNPDKENGSFVKLPAGFEGSLSNDQGLKAVVVKGKAVHQWGDDGEQTSLSPSSFFSSESRGEHRLMTSSEVVLYVNSNSRYTVE